MTNEPYDEISGDKELEAQLAEDDRALLDQIGPASDALRARILADAQAARRSWMPRWVSLSAPSAAAAALAALFARQMWVAAPAALPVFVAEWSGSPPPFYDGDGPYRGDGADEGGTRGVPSVPLGNLYTVRLESSEPFDLKDVRVGLFGASGFEALPHVRLDVDGALEVVVPVRQVRQTPGAATVQVAIGPAKARDPAGPDAAGWQVFSEAIEVVPDPE